MDEGTQVTRQRRRVGRGLMVWLALSTAGVAVVAMPDAGERVLTLSAGHGPSAGDLVGVALMLLGWAALLVPLLGARSLVPRPGLVLALVAAGLALVVWSVSQDAGSWWVLGAALAAAAQLAVALVVAVRQ